MLDSWFRAVPAYRIAAFRVVLATTTLCNYLPVVTGWLLQAAASPSTTASIPWFIHLPPPVVIVLLLLGYAAGIALLLGWRPSLAATWLVALGACGYAAGNHSHNGFLHLLLLALVACSADGLTLRRLAGGRDTDATCPVWPERLLRLQLAIVYFHTSIDKMFSPEWGLGGLRLTHLESTRVLPGVADLERGIAPPSPGLQGSRASRSLSARCSRPSAWRCGRCGPMQSRRTSPSRWRSNSCSCRPCSPGTCWR